MTYSKDDWNTKLAPKEALCPRCNGYGLLGDDPSGQNLTSCTDCDETGLREIIAIRLPLPESELNQLYAPTEESDPLVRLELIELD